jgi:hypothetical protein
MVGIISTSILFERGELVTTDTLPPNPERYSLIDPDLGVGISETLDPDDNRDTATTAGPVTRGISEVGTQESIDQELLSSLAPFRPSLLQAGQTVLPQGNVEENTPWTVSAQSILNGTARLYNVESDGTLILLDTQPAYESLFFTFNDFEVSDQSSLDLRLTIVDEDLSTEITFNLSYSVE